MTQFFILFAVATVISAVGFKKFVYFISIGTCNYDSGIVS